MVSLFGYTAPGANPPLACTAEPPAPWYFRITASRTLSGRPYVRSYRQHWHAFFNFEHTWQITVRFMRAFRPGCQRNWVVTRPHTLHSAPFGFFIMRAYGLSPRHVSARAKWGWLLHLCDGGYGQPRFRNDRKCSSWDIGLEFPPEENQLTAQPGHFNLFGSRKVNIPLGGYHGNVYRVK